MFQKLTKETKVGHWQLFDLVITLFPLIFLQLKKTKNAEGTPTMAFEYQILTLFHLT